MNVATYTFELQNMYNNDILFRWLGVIFNQKVDYEELLVIIIIMICVNNFYVYPQDYET